MFDSKDYCPDDSPQVIAMVVPENGCPKHSDFDGTPDYHDSCADTPRGVATDRHGSPK
jgi:OOP family OmpA-OmpF porin